MKFWRFALVIAVAACEVTWAPANASAQADGDSQTVVVQPLPASGETTVRYFNGGALDYTSRIPGDSMFHTSGRGSGGGGAPVPCRVPPFSWSVTVQPDSPPVTDPTASSVPAPVAVTTNYLQDSFAWNFRELVPTGTWTPVGQAEADLRWNTLELGPGIEIDTPVTLGQEYFAEHAPLATATRRFELFCGPSADYPYRGPGWDPELGEFLRYSEVPMTDPFWNPLERLGILWGMIQLPSYRVIAPPEVNTYGGLVVNMPTWLQIEANAWRPYFTDVDEYMGWTSQLGLFPSGLRFEVVGTGGGTIPCAPAESTARGGAIPGAPADLPRYYELGQLDQDCTWVPQEPGQVTVRARITYDVLLTVSGYSEWLSPYVWYSDPLTMSVGELRIRNITPEGGIGG